MDTKLKQMVKKYWYYAETFSGGKKNQTEITMYFHKVMPNVLVSPASNSTYSASDTLGTARSTLSLPHPPPPTKCEETKNEDLYYDPLPLNE